MCGICGYLSLTPSLRLPTIFLENFGHIMKQTSNRGLDSGGLSEGRAYGGPVKTCKVLFPPATAHVPLLRHGLIDRELLDTHDHSGYNIGLANFRGIPTTENFDFGHPQAIQPYQDSEDTPRLIVTHNGLLHNDVELSKRYAYEGGIGRVMTDSVQDIDSYIFIKAYQFYRKQYPGESLDAIWGRVLSDVKGSYAVVLYDAATGVVHFGRTFPGLYFALYSAGYTGARTLAWASEAAAFEGTPYDCIWEMPRDSRASYTVSTDHWVRPNMALHDVRRQIQSVVVPFQVAARRTSAIVVFSGGLDSTVVATLACQRYSKVVLLNFQYGAVAEGPEQAAVTNVWNYLRGAYPDVDLSLEFESIDLFTKIGGSNLTDPTLADTISDGAAGVEEAKEWVPARNTVMIAHAAAYADRYGLDAIMLGCNREEAGAFGDNSQEFYDAWNPVLGVGTKSKSRVEMPVGHMMKSHIVETAYRIGAPIHLSWSCYRSGDEPCGRCAPDYMRLQAHRMNNVRETVRYACYPEWYPDRLKLPGHHELLVTISGEERLLPAHIEYPLISKSAVHEASGMVLTPDPLPGYTFQRTVTGWVAFIDFMDMEMKPKDRQDSDLIWSAEKGWH